MMTPSRLILAGALAGLGTAAGKGLPFGNGQKVGQWTGIRGGRRLQGALCNSIGCPAGYTPIADAQFVECVGTCLESQCCEAFCSYHACPDGYVPIQDAGTTMCEDSGCTDSSCCVTISSGSESSTSYIADDTLSDDNLEIGSYLLDDDGDDVDNDDGDDVDNDDGDDVDDDDDDDDVDDDDDDVDDDDGLFDGGDLDYGSVVEGPHCNSIGCSAGYTPIEDAQTTVCDGDTCSESQCCEAFCSYHACPDNYTPIMDASMTLCNDSGCTDALCCESGDEVIDSAILGIDDSYGLSGGLISTLEDNDDPSYSYSLSAGLGSTPEDNDDSSYSFDFD